MVTPLKFPPGRARVGTRPSSMAKLVTATIGMDVVAA
jgi:hypothetical protein